jgi:hypothetical protein
MEGYILENSVLQMFASLSGFYVPHILPCSCESKFFSTLTLLLLFHISVNFRVYHRLKHSSLFTVTDAMLLLLDVNAFSIIKMSGNAASQISAVIMYVPCKKINNKDG